jgi:hypothetical protein
MIDQFFSFLANEFSWSTAMIFFSVGFFYRGWRDRSDKKYRKEMFGTKN